MDIQTIFASLASVLSNQNEILKIILILLLLLFSLFTLVLSRQVSLLTGMFNQVSFTPMLKLITYLIILTTVALLVIVIFV
ncbi:MAG: DUF5657 family protein [Candidatus Levyibacteriota bacterium]